MIEIKGELAEALWSGDMDRVHEIAGCICCCFDHTFDNCPARPWGGCRGQGQVTKAERDEWADHYAEHHEMTRDQFFNYNDRR